MKGARSQGSPISLHEQREQRGWPVETRVPGLKVARRFDEAQCAGKGLQSDRCGIQAEDGSSMFGDGRFKAICGREAALTPWMMLSVAPGTSAMG